GSNPRHLERTQMVRLMNLIAEVFFAKQWDPDIGGNKLESRIQKGESIPEAHVRAWRLAREEVFRNIVEWIRLVIENYDAFTGKMVNKERLLHATLPDELWDRIKSFLENLAALPCWIDRNLSSTV